MQNMDVLVMSLEYIEAHLKEELKTKEIATACFCSKSTLDKVFRYVNDISVQEYIKRRRMVLAAETISLHPDRKILSIALEYGYSSHESFARAFNEVWNCRPSDFRNKKYYELYPKLRRPITEGSEYIMKRKNVDISELYNLFYSRRNCWFICCDIKQLIPINNISRKAGDLAILEAMRRMAEVAGENDMIFRIGGDEFCLLTDSDSSNYADTLVEQLLAMNEKEFLYGEQKIPLSMYIAKTKYDRKHMKYNELFQELHNVLKESKQ